MEDEAEPTISILDMLNQLQGAELLEAARLLVKRCRTPLLLGPWESTGAASGPTVAEQEQWVRRAVDGTAILTVTPTAWQPIERSGRRERVQVSRLSVDLTSVGGVCAPGSTSTPLEAFQSADASARQAGCILVGDPPPTEGMTGDRGPKSVFLSPPAPPPPTRTPFSSVEAAAGRPAPMRAWGSVGVRPAPAPEVGRLLMLPGGKEDEVTPKPVEVVVPEIVDPGSAEGSGALTEIDQKILVAIRDLTAPSPEIGAASPIIAERTELPRDVVKATLKKLHKTGYIQMLTRPLQDGEAPIPGMPHGHAPAGFRLA